MQRKIYFNYHAIFNWMHADAAFLKHTSRYNLRLGNQVPKFKPEPY